MRSVVAYNTDSKMLPSLRNTGILLVQPTPEGGIISGTSSVVTLAGRDWTEAAYALDRGVHLNWPAQRAG